MIIEWTSGHWSEIVELILAIIGAASIIVKWTPTPKDDAVLGRIKDFVSEWIALNPKK